jgi:2-polyprenyl-3-methyl-5-hydroxy-6-metoxy-1,4-benzoquinol methylase
MTSAQIKTNLSAFDGRYQHAFNKIQFHIPESLRNGRFLDIGCGMGNAVIAALKHGASLAVGIDRSLEEFGHQFAASEFPFICQNYGVDPEKSLLLQANIFDLGFNGHGFDYVFMLDAIEHVPDPRVRSQSCQPYDR